MKKILFLLCITCNIYSFGQLSRSITSFDYKNINTQTFIPMQGWSEEQKYILSVLKHSFEMKHILSTPRDTVFFWNGLMGEKTIYSKDSLIIFILRSADTVTRPCILLTHGNTAKYRSSWSENLNFYAIDLAMRGYCVAYYENPTSYESKEILAQSNGTLSHVLAKPRNAFYSGFQSAAAADIFVRHNAAILKVDTTKIFAGGFSFGAFCSMMLATTDAGVNFTDSVFNVQGNFSAKSIYNDTHTKNINHVFSISGGLPKDDTLPLNSSHMGNFLASNDSNLSILFLHGRTDNLVSFDLTSFADTAGSPDFFWGEGPRALMNNIAKENLSNTSRLFVNCRSGHPYFTSVCGYSNPYCLQQWQWQYLAEPPADMSSTNAYFQDSTRDTLLHYFAYMMTQLNDIGFLIGDFLQPAILNTTSVFPDGIMYLAPRDSFTYVNSSGHLVLKNTDCEGNSIIITSIKKNIPVPSSLKAYPNPTNAYITFETTEPMERIAVYSIVGALIKEMDCHDLQEQMDVHDLAAGEYIFTIKLKDKMLTQKVSVLK